MKLNRKPIQLIATFGLTYAPEVVHAVVTNLLDRGVVTLLPSGTDDGFWNDGIFAPDILADAVTQ